MCADRLIGAALPPSNLDNDLLDALPVALIGLDEDGTVDRINAPAREVLGADVLGQHVSQIAWDADGEEATVPATGRFEWTLRQALGWRTFEGDAAARPDGGWFLTVRDVTAERRMRDLLEDQKDVLEALGTGRPLDDVLERIAELVHYGLPGSLCAILDYDETGEELRVRAAPGLDAAEREALRTGRGAEAFAQIPIHSAVGTTLGVLAIRPGDGPLLDDVIMAAVQLSGSAITARRADAALLQAQKLESLGLLAGGIAHDFNNLLTSSLGNLKLLRDQIGVASPLHPYLSRVERSTRKAAELTRQLLTYSGRAEGVARPVDMNALLAETVSLLDGTTGAGVVIRFEAARGTPAVVGDEAQLQQVVMNLAINASEAIGSDAGLVTLRLREVELDAGALDRSFSGQTLRPGAYVEVEVEDDGCGMNGATIERIFDPFFTTKFTGRGLGLAATAGVVRGLRGGIWIQSEPGVGTTFRVLLPASRAQPTRGRAEAPTTLFGEGRGLVVDDEHDVRQLVATVLGAAGFDVVQAADGKEAVDTYERQGPFRLIVMDLTMPRMGGGEALDRIRDLDPDVPCLLASGYPEGEAPLGDDHTRFIQKPFRLARLKASIAALLGGSEE